MFLCRVVDLLYRGAPFGAWRSFLIRRHMDACPACRAALASREEARSVLVQAKDAAAGTDIWAAIESRMDRAPERADAPTAAPRLLWRWAAGAAMVLVLATAGIWLFRSVRSADTGFEKPVAESFQIDDLRMNGQPARAIIYRPRNSDMVVVWAEENNDQSKS